MKILVVTLVVFFAVAVLVIELLVYGYRTLSGAEKRKSRQRLRMLAQTHAAADAPDIQRNRLLSSVPVLNRFLLRSPLKGLEILTRQANARYPLGVYVLLTVVLALAGFVFATGFAGGYAIPALSALVAGTLPCVFLLLKKRQRMQKFQRQLPDALELIGRALRAGHALTTGMKLAAEQFEDPLGPEFEVTLEEVNFGLSVPDALRALSQRVDCPDLKYFVVSVIIQREAGGNLAEIIESIARIVRERFKFQDKLKVLAAEGKLSARILIALPIFLVFSINSIDPEYLRTLIEEPMGRTLSWIAGTMMVFGIIVIVRMAKIKV
jgi:tight adherence protein B